MKLSTGWIVAAGMGLLLAALATTLVLTTAPASSADSAAAPPGQPPAADDAVQRALRQGRPTVAEFGANACAQCREMKPVLEALKREQGDKLAVVNIDLIAQREAPYIQRYRIQLMPTQVFYDAQGREIGRHMGMISGAEILARLGLPS